MDYGKRARRGDAEEPPEDAAATDVPLCPLALAAAQMPVGHVDDAEEGEEFDEDAARAVANSMKVPELRAALEDLGEDTEGKKAELVDRLVAAQAAEGARLL